MLSNIPPAGSQKKVFLPARQKIVLNFINNSEKNNAHINRSKLTSTETNVKLIILSGIIQGRKVNCSFFWRPAGIFMATSLCHSLVLVDFLRSFSQQVILSFGEWIIVV